WTSGGQLADLGMLLARTNPDAAKHKGITYFAIDMNQPGIEVRPLREMTGRALFNEVFFTDARVRSDAIIGGLNEGWAVALTTLANERVALGGGGGAVGNVPGPRGGMLELRAGDVGARSGRGRTGPDVGMEILGASGMLHGSDAPMNGAVQELALFSPAVSIYGGSDEIQHNIIGERVLGLPKEPATDKGVPFRDLKVGTQATARS